MMSTWLVQRLEKKPKSEFEAKASQVFGGGNLQMGPDAWKLLNEVFSFAYMGAAEYEFGVISQTLKSLVIDRENLTAFRMVFTRGDVSINYAHERDHNYAHRLALDEAKKKKKSAPRKKPLKLPAFEPKTVYVICRKQHKERVAETLRCMAMGTVRTKQGHWFDLALDPATDDPFFWRTIGWLELDNGFFAFIDEEAFKGTCKIFLGTDTPDLGEPVPAKPQ